MESKILLNEAVLRDIQKKIKSDVNNCRVRIQQVSKNARTPTIFVRTNKKRDTIIMNLRISDKKMYDFLKTRTLSKKIKELMITECFLCFEPKIDRRKKHNIHTL